MNAKTATARLPKHAIRKAAGLVGLTRADLLRAADWFQGQALLAEKRSADPPTAR